MGRALYTLSLLLVILFLTTACTNNTPDDSKTETESVKIGGLFGLSGFAAFAGEAGRDGFLMAIEDSGMDVEYVIEDTRSDFVHTVTAAKKLVEIDGASVVIGPEWNEFSEVIIPIAEENGVLFISPWMDNERIDTSDYYFSGTPSARNHVKKIIEHMLGEGQTKVVLVYSNNAWAIGNTDFFKEEAEKQEGFEVIEEFRVDHDTTDFRTEILRIKELAPDAIYSAISTDNSAGLLDKQFQEQNIKISHYIPFSRAESEVFLDAFGEYVEGDIYIAPVEYKNIQAFREKYEERFGKKSTAISAPTAYDMTTLVLQAIKEGATTSDEIIEYLLNVKDYDGYFNLINFNEQGQVVSEELEIKQITSEGPVVLSE